MLKKAVRVTWVLIVTASLLYLASLRFQPLYQTNHSFVASGQTTFYSWELVNAKSVDGYCEIDPNQKGITVGPMGEKPYKILLVMPVPSGVRNCQFGVVPVEVAGSTKPKLGTSHYELVRDRFMAGMQGKKIETIAVLLARGRYALTRDGRPTDFQITVT